VTFDDQQAPVTAPVSNWSADSITVTVPTGLVSGGAQVYVTPNDQVAFTVAAVYSADFGGHRETLSFDPTAPIEGPSNSLTGFQTNNARFACLVSGSSPLLFYTDSANPGLLVAVGSCGSDNGRWTFSD
jgi:hypothetical protein